MSLDDCSVVDAIGTDKVGGAVVLSIVDYWDWQDERRHLAALQEKLNIYFGFVESGQIYKSYPEAVGKPLRIDIISRFPVPPVGLEFFEKAAAVAATLQMSITHRMG